MRHPTRWAPAVSGTALLGIALLLSAPAVPAQEEVEGHRGFMAGKGRVTYRVYCSNCHGPEARGKGNLAQFLTVAPSDLTLLSAENDGEFPRDLLHEVIDGRRPVRGHGGKEMPVWGDVFQHSLAEPTPVGAESGEERAKRKIAELVLYIETIQVETQAPSETQPEPSAEPEE